MGRVTCYCQTDQASMVVQLAREVHMRKHGGFLTRFGLGGAAVQISRCLQSPRQKERCSTPRYRNNVSVTVGCISIGRSRQHTAQFAVYLLRSGIGRFVPRSQVDSLVFGRHGDGNEAKAANLSHSRDNCAMIDWVLQD